ncbi:NAD-glutamate dehydrogenase [Blastomonas fulva]|uniref:NAD-glutamate dehydrogenase n=1 Tax=Blastomonas fulva TaxID=1550728 RepID=UPI0025A4ADAB|nr:NAD-glutamate dehydrogenase domain-containing protein [Blastomonas fulva]MDM7930268.1 NAD-glutamate dehydrogenase [Blastomonas fulva]MDM7967815.1 NAD-glutamate dehydrogenase [Blastomonas fulva]
MAETPIAASGADAGSSVSSNATPLIDPQQHARLRAVLADAFLKGALPGENEGFDDAACSEAADFALRAMARRPSSDTVLTIESIPGQTGHRHMRLAIINDDMPFLVDSIAAAISRFGLAIDRVIHPVVALRRDADGLLSEIYTDEAPGERRESVVYLEVERADARQRKALETALMGAMADVRAAVTDWPMLQAAMAADAAAMADGEGAALLRWFLDRNMTQLAHLRYRRDGSAEAPLGIARINDQPLLAAHSFDQAFAWFESGKAAPLIIKSNFISTVHRRAPLDLVILPIWEDGRVAALSVHGGIWTSAALAAAPERVPVLRAHLKLLMDKFGFSPNGHAGKALSHALTALPHDLLIAFSLENLERVALTAMSLADRPRSKLVTVQSSLRRHLFVFAWLPRDEVSTGRREAIERMVIEASGGKTLSWSISLEDGEIALIRYVIDMRDGAAAVDDAALDSALRAMVRGWEPSVEEALIALGEDSRAAALASRYAPQFPMAYRSDCGPKEAALDIVRLRDLDSPERHGARLYRRADDAAQHLRLKLYSLTGAIPLSQTVPALENFGFDVLEEVPTALGADDSGHIHDFLLHLRGTGDAESLMLRAGAIEAAISGTLEGKAENDPFNRLIAATGLEQRAVIWLRAWYRYLRQAGLPYGIGTVVDALHDAPDIAHALIALFIARHDPAFTGDREAATQANLAAITSGLTQVSAIDDDRLLRMVRALVMAILRTNAFAPAASLAMVMKIDSAKVPGLPAPLPWREMFVYSPQVEGIHLRAGPVARGGLRWSDRRDDFRTEVLGLMKAQRVKNAVIVPTGAKGGFFPKQLPDPATDREGWLNGGKDAYKTFIRTLLSITDNIVDGKVVHPAQVVVHDGEDPYFVVAADKGTATFSDTANAIAAEFDFWLGDAFASGGSQGYDHKAMGITAKGGWVSVQRHFAEMGVDVQSDPVRVAGCGDMSGDVFGNGMLLSKSIKLVAAFDHRHIFLDPDPDAAASWAERQRMFALPRSSWDDYEKALISKGGGVFSRAMKSIPLTAEVKAMLGLEGDEIEPAALISAILRAEVDLLWFGGIGTYIKAASENNIDVGDPSNDQLRINAEQLRCKVVGEGANLGVTQAARIAFSMLGGRINTDFIDNSAGVDCSDNEVNIKIGLAAVMRAGLLDEPSRNALLASMTDDVSMLVLEDNRLQALGLSIAERAGVKALPSYIRLIEHFEEQGRLDRKVEGLADNATLKRRAQEGHGLTRPELAVVLSTAKLTLQDAIERIPLADDPTMRPELLAAFPPQMREAYGDVLMQHQLRGEIIATKLANRMINRLGLIHPFELAEEEGCTLGDVACAFIAAERLFALPAIWAEFDHAEMDEQVRLMLFDATANIVRVHIADVLRASADGLMPGAIVAALKPGVDALIAQMDNLLNAEARLQAARQAQDLVGQGASSVHAAHIVRLTGLDGAAGLANLASTSATDPMLLTQAFADLGATLGLDWTQMTAARMSPSDPWERLLVSGLARDFQQMRLDFLQRAKGSDPQDYVAGWTEANLPRIKQFRTLVDRARMDAAPSVAMLAQIASQARILLAR